MEACFASLRPALRVFLLGHSTHPKAASHADHSAMPLAILRQHNVQSADLRWLLSKGYIREVTPEAGTVRASGGTPRCIRISRGSVFALTPNGRAAAREVSDSNGLFALKTDGDSEKPVWDAESRELRYRRYLVKRFKRPAAAQEIILAAFEEETWPPHIFDPLPPRGDSVPAQRLRTTIRNLNSGHLRRLVRFESDGRGEGIHWYTLEEAS